MGNSKEKLTLKIKREPKSNLQIRKLRRRRLIVDGKPIIEINISNPSKKSKIVINNKLNNNKLKSIELLKKEIKKNLPIIPKKKKGPFQLFPKKRIPINEAIFILSNYWDNFFPNGQLRPMAIGTKEALLVDMRNKGLDISRKKINRCLSGIAHTLEYRNLIILGASRYDKDGQKQGIVDKLDVEHNQKYIEQIKRQLERQSKLKDF